MCLIFLHFLCREIHGASTCCRSFYWEGGFYRCRPLMWRCCPWIPAQRQDIPPLMTKANGISLMVKHEEAEEKGTEGRRESGEVERWMGWFGGVAGEARGRSAPVLSVYTASRSCLAGQKQDCWQEKMCCFDLTLWRLSPHFFIPARPPLSAAPLCLPSSPSTLPSSTASSGTSQRSLCRLSRWPSLRSALECCFYIAASGGMWSLFWTAWQTDGGFHAAFMRLSETFP